MYLQRFKKSWSMKRRSITKRNRRTLRPFEELEARRVFASDWQNTANPLDVDNSGLVVALDVLQIVNDINSNGIRALPTTRPNNYSGALCDTNGDGSLSGIDVLLVVNAINQFPDAPTLTVNLSTASDRNGDDVVLTPNVSFVGASTPNVNVKVEYLVDGHDTIPTNIPTLFSTTASANGTFELPITLSAPVNHLRFTVSDPRGRSLTTERLVRKGDVVSSWNSALLEVVRETTAPSTIVPGLLIKPPPPLVAKYLAMVHGAMFDAVNAVDQQYDSYKLTTAPQAGASSIAAAAQAAYEVASHVYDLPTEMVHWDDTLAEVLATVPDGAAKTQGIQLGHLAAQAMINARANDGSTTTVTYVPGTQPGDWRPTAPGFLPATLPQWPDVTPFAIDDPANYRPAAPPALSSVEYANAVDQVKRLGSATSSERTADQTAIAKFWADGGGTSTPPGHWNQIAIDAVLESNQTLVERARTMALLNFALADAGIASWDAKYVYDYGVQSMQFRKPIRMATPRRLPTHCGRLC